MASRVVKIDEQRKHLQPSPATMVSPEPVRRVANVVVVVSVDVVLVVVVSGQPEIAPNGRCKSMILDTLVARARARLLRPANWLPLARQPVGFVSIQLDEAN